MDDDGAGVVYVFGEVGPDAGSAVKIGLSRDEASARRRHRQLAKGNPRQLEMLHAHYSGHPRWDEHQLHVVLEPFRMKQSASREWFDVRHLVSPAGDWAMFIANALAGTIPGAAPLPSPPPVGTHSLLHLTGRTPGSLVPCCACGWKGDRGSVHKALQRMRSHLDAVSAPM